jgi:hypothetical protein
MMLARAGALAAAFACLAPAATAQEAQPPPSLSVSGHARLERPPDELRLELAVVTEGHEAAGASAENARIARQVFDALAAGGLEKGEIETGSFSVQPVYTQPPGEMRRGWKPEIAGYRVENSVRVETRKIELAGRLVDAAVRAGANHVSSLAFGLSDERAHRADAIREATANARADAAALAESAGVRLVRLLSARLDGASAPPVPLHRGMEAFAMAQDAAPPLEPGSVEVQAQVSLVYEIAGK